MKAIRALGRTARKPGETVPTVEEREPPGPEQAPRRPGRARQPGHELYDAARRLHAYPQAVQPQLDERRHLPGALCLAAEDLEVPVQEGAMGEDAEVVLAQGVDDPELQYRVRRLDVQLPELDES